MKGQRRTEGGSGKKSGARRGLLIGLAAAALVAAGIIAFLGASGAFTKSKAILSALDLLDEESLGLDLDLSVAIDDDEYHLEASVRNALTKEGIPVSRITYRGLSLYCAEGAVFLEDGTAWRLTEEDADNTLSDVLDYAGVLYLIKTLYADSDAAVLKEGGTTIYSITLGEEASLELLTALYPPAAQQITGMSALSVDLYTKNGTATAIAISGGAEVNNSPTEKNADRTFLDAENDATDTAHGVSSSGNVLAEGGTELEVDVRLEILTGEEGTFSIPDAVLQAISAGEYGEAPVLTQELLGLLSAWNTLSTREFLAADIGIDVDFGLLSLSGDMTWTRTKTEGEAVNSIAIGEKTWYFTDDWTSYGTSGTQESEDTDAAAIDPLFLLETAYEIFMDGGFSVREEGESDIYTVSLTQEQMETIVVTLIPEAEDLGISYQGGQFTAVVTDDEFASLALTSGGSTKILFSEIPINLTIQVTMQ